jgi:hypothetical protein
MKRPVPCADWDYCPECNGAGEVPDANFSCSACNAEGTIPARRFHYEVFSEVMTSFSYGEPPEPSVAWGMYFVHNAAEAKKLAVQDKDFSEWVTMQRGDGVPPFKGLTARLTRCEHGSCWGCNSDEDSSGCEECDREIEAYQP